jgi:hypothetical protein
MPVVIGRGAPSGSGWNHRSDPYSGDCLACAAPVNTMPDPSGIHDVNAADANVGCSERAVPVATSTIASRARRLSPSRTTAAIRSPVGDHEGAMKNPGARMSGSRTAISVRSPDPSARTVTSALSPGFG